MKAIILAAGKGTRMGQLTNEVPKPMLKAYGKPILEHILEGLQGAGIREMFIVVGFRGEVIEQYFGGSARWRSMVKFGRQQTQDGTGKAPEVAREFTSDSSFILTYGDILVPPETYGRMVARYNQGGAAGVITVTRGEDVTKGGVNFFDESFFLKRLVEKPTEAQLSVLRRDGWLKPGAPVWYNAGIYLFEPTLFEFTARLKKSPRGEYELTDAVSGLIEAGHKLAGLEIAGRWVDVRDPEVLERLQSGLMD